MYSMFLYDRYGCCGEWTRHTLAEILPIAAAKSAEFPKLVVAVTNNEQVDRGFDGLTDDERDEVDQAIRGAK
jgi:hypothetical protein